MFKSSDNLTELINDDRIIKIGDIANCVTGFYSGCDRNYLHPINGQKQLIHVVELGKAEIR